MLHDARRLEAGTRLAHDFCIVGAGAAGIALAREFLGSSTRVCVLESGGLAFDRAAQALADGENVGHPYFPIGETRLRRFGGTTGWWSGECRPLDPEEDLAPHPWLGHGGWPPVAAADLAARYGRAEALCGLGPGAFEPAAAWFDRRGSSPLPLDPCRFATRIFKHSPPTDFARAYGRDLERATNVDVLLNATALSVETDDAGKVAAGVRAASAPGRELEAKAPVVVLAAGGIENARLLLASTRARPAGLGNRHDQVGRCFMEHLFFDDVARFEPVALLPSIRLYARRWTAAGSEVRATLAPTAALLAEARMLNCCFKFASLVKRHPGVGAALALRDGWRRGLPWSRQVATLPALVAGLPGAAAALLRAVLEGEHGSPGRPAPLLVNVVSEQAPNSGSRVTLSRRRDRFGQPLARLEWRLGEADRASWLKGLELLARDLAGSGLGRLVLPDPRARDAAIERVRGGRHHMGTTRMADDPRRGVVDRDARVHGISNLYVAGSSVFPTSGHADPTLSIVALALRLADHLKAVHLRP
jgi:choline dehydrogenase-like flavoprotein